VHPRRGRLCSGPSVAAIRREDKEPIVSAGTVTVVDGKVVSLEYVLRDDEGEVLDQSEPGDPLLYLHGAENIVPGLERALTGRRVGDALDVVVEPESAYGPREGGLVEVSRDAFPADAELEVGQEIAAELDDGTEIPYWIIEVHDDRIVVDPNHPLAGVTLHFAVKVVDIRDASKDELDHGHPHGPDGHHH
jgi:FKBP-type peptidyl-prolyl cis-trans isomerase SlyD